MAEFSTFIEFIEDDDSLIVVVGRQIPLWTDAERWPKANRLIINQVVCGNPNA